MARERMQYDRRVDQVPWTWEPWAGAALLFGFCVLVTAQFARTLANLLATGTLTFPSRQQLMFSSFGVLGGNPAAGLTPTAARHHASTPALIVCLVILEAAMTCLFGWAVFKVVSIWGPQRMLGMATREDAEKILGVTRLRKQAGVIRPDLYGPKKNRQPRTPDEPGRPIATRLGLQHFTPDPTPTSELPIVPRSSIDDERKWTW